jgi:8-oxo-dGTP diphosphatase
VKIGEGLAGAASHRLEEEAGITGIFLHQVAAVGTPGRDPSGDTVAVLHYGLVGSGKHSAPAPRDARPARWFPAEPGQLPALELDHSALVELALESLRRRAGETPAVFELLPEEFTFTELQSLFEAVVGRELDRRNFRRKVKELELVSKTRGSRRSGAHRPARLFRFSPRAFAAYAGKSGALPFR